MAIRGAFTGNALQAIDAKGRVAIPAPFRQVLEANSGEKAVVLSAHLSEACVVGYDRGYLAVLLEKTQAKEAADIASGREFDRDSINRATFGDVDDVAYDGSGRFVVPPYLKSVGQLGDWAYFVSAGQTFEIWNPHLLLESERVLASSKDRCRFEMRQRGLEL